MIEACTQRVVDNVIGCITYLPAFGECTEDRDFSYTRLLIITSTLLSFFTCLIWVLVTPLVTMSISSPDPVTRLVDGITYMRLADDTPSFSPPGPPPPPSTDEELEAFRKEWRQEVQAKKHDPQAHSQVHPLIWNGEPTSSYSQTGPSSEAKERTLSPRRPTKLPSPQQQIHALPPSAPSLAGPSTARRPRKVVEADEDPVAIYAQAVEHEQSGRLNDALRMYRRAFKLDGGSPSYCRVS